MIRFLFAAALIFLSGCVHLDEVVQINGDGSAQITLKYSMPVEGMTLLQDSEEVLQELNKQKVNRSMPRIFNEESMRQHFKKFAGVTVISLRINEENKRVQAYLNLRVENLRQSLRQGLFPYTSLEKDEDSYIFAALYPYNMKKLKQDNQLKEMARQLNVSFKVKTPGKILATNAPQKSDKVATWNYSSKTTPFSQCDGRFMVKFDAKGLSFLEDDKQE